MFSAVTEAGNSSQAFQISVNIDRSVICNENALSRAIRRRAGLVFIGPWSYRMRALFSKLVLRLCMWAQRDRFLVQSLCHSTQEVNDWRYHRRETDPNL